VCRRHWAAAAGWGKPKDGPLYIVMSSDNRAGDDQNYLFTHRRLLSTVNLAEGSARLFANHRVSVGRPGEFRRPPFTRLRLIVSSALRRFRTALTDEGLLLGKLVFGSIAPRPPTLAPSVCLRLRSDVGDPSLHRALTKH
jgi:hypothetical protein